MKITIPISEYDIELFEQIAVHGSLRSGHRLAWYIDGVEVIFVKEEEEE
jgi:hypothetical protein|tara:strand:+ start:402 stop:548 length:147 start_codon:yes stop_codon:yes gene_type:complete